MGRAWTVDNVMGTSHPQYPFKGLWYQAFRQPSKIGTWFIYANSSNGKTTFVLQLIKELAQYDKVLYDSLEEGNSDTMKEAFYRVGMNSVAGQVSVVKEDFQTLRSRLRKRKSPRVVVIDSIQYFRRFSFDKYLELEKEFPDKLFVVISQAKGKEPKGQVADDIKYHANLKIWVEGYVAFSQGRYIGPRGFWVIYEEGARKYHGDDLLNYKVA